MLTASPEQVPLQSPLGTIWEEQEFRPTVYSFQIHERDGLGGFSRQCKLYYYILT